MIFSMDHYSFIIYCRCSAILLFMFNLARLCALEVDFNNLTYLLLVILLVIGAVNGIIRSAVNLGHYIDHLPKSEFLIKTLGEFAERVFLRYSSVKHYYHINPNSSGNPMHTLARYALVATITTVPIGLGVLYETHRAAEGSIRSAIAKEKQTEVVIRQASASIRVTEQEIAMNEVTRGLRTQEQYNEKYPLK